MANKKMRKEEKEEEVDEEDFNSLLEGSEGEEEEEEEEEEGMEEIEMEEIDQEEVDEAEYQKEFQALQRLKSKTEAKPLIYKGDEMKEIAEEMKVKMPGGKDLTWEESLVLFTTESSKDLDAQDDLNREKTFYSKTLESVNVGVKLLRKNNISFRRPTDYFAEMLKSDDQMKKVKGALLKQKEDIESAEERRRKREQKKFGKKIEAAKRVEKVKQKSDNEKKIKKWSENSSLGFDEFPVLAGEQEESNNPKKRKLENGKEAQMSKKRQAKNEKFKTPGRRRGDKRNTGESAADLSSFNLKKNKTIDPDLKRKVGQKKKAAPAKRPGKSQRRTGGKRK